MEALRFIGVPGYTAMLFRRTYKELSQQDGLIERSKAIYPSFGGKYNEQKYVWKFPPYGTEIGFSHMEHESDRENHKSAQYAYVFFDELTTFLESQYLYIFSRVRTTAVDPRTGKTIPARVRSGSNPDGEGHEWVYNRFGRWLKDPEDESLSGDRASSGEVRWYLRGDDDVDREVPEGTPHALSRQFIRSCVWDNPKLLEKDPGYVDRLMALPLVERLALLDGMWNIALKGNVFKAEWFLNRVYNPPEDLRWYRYWDLAASLKTRADFTASPAAAFDKGSGVLYLRDMVHVKKEWPDVEKLIVDITLSDDIFETGIEKKAHGLAAVQTLLRKPELLDRRFIGVDIGPGEDKLARALTWSGRAEQGKVVLVERIMPHKDIGYWIPGFIAEATSFDGKGKLHDDRVDGVSGVVKMVAGMDRQWRRMRKFLHL
jgi:predicted phage terminase large subunit-like protein